MNIEDTVTNVQQSGMLIIKTIEIKVHIFKEKKLNIDQQTKA